VIDSANDWGWLVTEAFFAGVNDQQRSVAFEAFADIFANEPNRGSDRVLNLFSGCAGFVYELGNLFVNDDRARASVQAMLQQLGSTRQRTPLTTDTVLSQPNRGN
jgi:hypothetical protein